MTIALESSFSRLLIHASAEFYGLVSFSRRSPTGKTTFIQKRSGFSAPGVSLFEFLSTQHGKSINSPLQWPDLHLLIGLPNEL